MGARLSGAPTRRLAFRTQVLCPRLAALHLRPCPQTTAENFPETAPTFPVSPSSRTRSRLQILASRLVPGSPSDLRDRMSPVVRAVLGCAGSGAVSPALTQQMPAATSEAHLSRTPQVPSCLPWEPSLHNPGHTDPASGLPLGSPRPGTDSCCLPVGRRAGKAGSTHM